VRRLSTGTEVIYTRVVHAPVEPAGQDAIASLDSQPPSSQGSEREAAAVEVEAAAAAALP
jgi:hypothetical protein